MRSTKDSRHAKLIRWFGDSASFCAMLCIVLEELVPLLIFGLSLFRRCGIDGKEVL